jgi:hypothetical protein
VRARYLLGPGSVSPFGGVRLWERERERERERKGDVRREILRERGWMVELLAWGDVGRAVVMGGGRWSCESERKRERERYLKWIASYFNKIIFLIFFVLFWDSKSQGKVNHKAQKHKSLPRKNKYSDLSSYRLKNSRIKKPTVDTWHYLSISDSITPV